MVVTPEGKDPRQAIPWQAPNTMFGEPMYHKPTFDKSWAKDAYEDKHQTHLTETHKWGGDNGCI